MSGNIAWLVGGHVFRVGLGLLVLSLVARFLGPDQFGILNYTIGLAVIFTSIATLGMEGIIIRELVRHPDSAPEILGTGFALRTAGSVVAVGVVVAVAMAVRTDPSYLPYLLVISLAFLPQSFEVIDLWFQKHIQSKYTILAKSAAILAGSGVKIALVIWKAPLMLFCVAYVFDFILAAAAMLIVYETRGGKFWSWNFSGQIARVLLRDSWPLMLSGLIVTAYMRIEQILVMNVLGSGVAGVYYASAKIIDIWALIPSFILTSVYPLLVEKRKSDPKTYHRRLQTVFDAMAGLGYVLALAVCLLAPVIIQVMYGPAYRGAVVILMIQAWYAPIFFSGSVRGQYMLLENINIYLAWSLSIGVALNVVLAFPLMNWLGASGAALAALISYWVASYGTTYLFPKLRGCGELQTKAFLLPFRLGEAFRALGSARR